MYILIVRYENQRGRLLAAHLTTMCDVNVLSRYRAVTVLLDQKLILLSNLHQTYRTVARGTKMRHGQISPTVLAVVFDLVQQADRGIRCVCVGAGFEDRVVELLG